MATVNQAQRFSKIQLVITFVASGGDLLSDTSTSSIEYGIVVGPAFLFTYGIVALPMARLVDYLPRLKYFLIFFSSMASATICLFSLATNFIGLLWPRIIFGISTAAFEPACLRMLSLYFPPHYRGIAYGCFMFSIYLGSSLSSLCIVLTEAVGWRFSFFIIGIIGTGISLVLGIFLKNEKNHNTERMNFTEDLKELVKNKTLVLVTLANILRYTGGFSRGFYEALFFTHEFSDKKTQYSVINAVAIILAPISLLVAGKYSDRVEMSGRANMKPLICSLTSLIPVPFFYLMYSVSVFWAAMGGVFVVYLIGESYISLSVAVLMNIASLRVRALRKIYLETGLLMGASFIGGSLSTIFLGTLSSDNLEYGLIGIVPTCYLGAGLLFLWAARVYPKSSNIELQEELTNDLSR